jgi:UPF0755 protein
MDIKKLINENFLKYVKIAIIGFFVILFLLVYSISFFLHQNKLIDRKKIVNIPSGYSIIKTSELLNEESILLYPKLLRYYMQYKNLSPKSGFYSFYGPVNIINISKRISTADYGEVYKKIIIPEGVNNTQLIEIIKKSDLNIDENKLKFLLKENEGYLFPDTYSFLPDANEADIVQEMKSTFLEKIEQAEENKTINKNRSDIVIMASLIEKEASRNLNEKQIISGILWKRISIGMPLQVDAPFLYEIGRGSAQLSNKDLKKDSPYNTYTNTGLTPTPIGNPGYDSLFASAHPKQSEYFFYLHGNDGVVHYAKTYTEHLKNKRMYLN